MSRLHFKNILKNMLSWIDSHIIDYPTAKLKLKKIITQTKKPGILIIVLASFLLYAPVLGIILLLIFTVNFLYNKKYKGIFFIWGRVFFIWYVVFTACLIGYDGPILIRPDFFSDGGDSETRRLFFILLISIGILVSHRASSTSILNNFVWTPLVYYV